MGQPTYVRLGEQFTKEGYGPCALGISRDAREAMQYGDDVTAEVVYNGRSNCMELCVAGLERATGLAFDGNDADVTTAKAAPSGPDYTLLAGAASTIESDDYSAFTPVELQAAS